MDGVGLRRRTVASWTAVISESERGAVMCKAANQGGRSIGIERERMMGTSYNVSIDALNYKLAIGAAFLTAPAATRG